MTTFFRVLTTIILLFLFSAPLTFIGAAVLVITGVITVEQGQAACDFVHTLTLPFFRF